MKKCNTRTELGTRGFIASHGSSRTKLYKVWTAMKQRCSITCSHIKSRNLYYGRGIRVCEEWLGDFLVFKDWATSNGYRQGLTIDRIDNDKGYSPDNCRWITLSENLRNKRLPHEWEPRKLTKDQVMELRRLYKIGVGYIELGKKFNVHPIHAQAVAVGRFWKSLPV